MCDFVLFCYFLDKNDQTTGPQSPVQSLEDSVLGSQRSSLVIDLLFSPI